MDGKSGSLLGKRIKKAQFYDGWELIGLVSKSENRRCARELCFISWLLLSPCLEATSDAQINIATGKLNIRYATIRISTMLFMLLFDESGWK